MAHLVTVRRRLAFGENVQGAGDFNGRLELQLKRIIGLALYAVSHTRTG